MTGRAHHYGVTVSDLETSLAFYRGRLSFDSEAFGRFAGVEDADIVFLDADGCVYELLEYRSPPGGDPSGLPEQEPRRTTATDGPEGSDCSSPVQRITNVHLLFVSAADPGDFPGAGRDELGPTSAVTTTNPWRRTVRFRSTADPL